MFSHMVSVQPSEVRERINVSTAEAPDDVVNRFIAAAAVTLSVEIDDTINPADCTDKHAEVIRNLAAIYCACRITGGSAQGLSFRIGDLTVDESTSSSPSGLSSSNLQFLLDQAKGIIEKQKAGDFRAVAA